MNIWFLSLGVLGVLGAAVWYVVLLNDTSPAQRVAFLSKGEIPTRSIYLWLLVVMLSVSFVVNAFDAARDGFGIMIGVGIAFAVSEIARWWHNRTVSVPADEPPAEWFSDDAPSP